MLRPILSTICFAMFCILLGLRAIPAVGADEAAITFRFTPTVGTTFDETVTKTTTTRQNGTSEVIVATAHGVTRIERGDAGYRYVSTLLDMSGKKNGVPLPDALAKAMRGLIVTISATEAGEIAAIDGYQDLQTRLIAGAPKEAAEAIRKAVDPALLAHCDMAQWRNRLTRFAGRTVNIGDQWIDIADVPISSTKLVTLYRATTIHGWKETQGKKVVQILVTCHSTAAGLAKQMGTSVETVRASTQEPALNAADSMVSLTSELLIDPATMMIFAEQSTLTTTQYQETQTAKRVPIVTTERKEIQYRYR